MNLASPHEERGLVTIERFLGCAKSAKCHWSCDLSSVTEARRGWGLSMRLQIGRLVAEEVGHCMLPYIRIQIFELAYESLLVVLL